LTVHRSRVATALAALLVACSDTPEPADPPKADARAPAAAPALAPGKLQLSLEDGRVSLVTREVPQAQILQALAARGGFE